MKGPTKYRALIIPILLTLLLIFGSLPASSNTQVTTGAQVKRVIFRDDDVTPWSLDALEAVNQVHIDEGVPVTLGVIPKVSFPVQGQYKLYVPTTSASDTFGKYLRSLASSGQLELRTGSIESFVEYLRNLTQSGRFELAQHGYNHSDNSKQYHVTAPTEFRGMPYATQYKLISEGRSLMQNAWGFAPTTFVPPYNTGDQNTLTALSRLGFKVYSSYESEFGSGGGLTLKPNRLEIDASTATYPWLVSQTEPLLSNPSVNDIVITYHNWQFEASTAHDVDAKKVELLRHYIQYLKTKNVEFTTLNGAHPSKRITTNMTLASSEPSITVNQKVTFTATLTLKNDITPLSSKRVSIYHYLNGVKYTDTTKTTTANGQITFVQTFGSAGQRTYYAAFAGDSQYANSQAGPVTIGVAYYLTTLSLSTNNATPTVNQKVTFTATLKNGTKPLSSKPVSIYHYLNGVRYTDTTKTTTANGQITFTQSFSSGGLRSYYATFLGDKNHKTSTSRAVNVNVGTPTTLNLIATPTAPPAGKPVTFTATLKSGTTPLSGKSVTIYHYDKGVKYTDTTKTTNAYGKITFTQTFGSTGQRQYYATFVGDSSHASSTSSIVNVNVGSTQIARSPSTTSPTAGKPVTFAVTLKSGTTPLSFKRVTSKSG